MPPYSSGVYSVKYLISISFYGSRKVNYFEVLAHFLDEFLDVGSHSHCHLDQLALKVDFYLEIENFSYGEH
jgi:hypothetical protein